MGVLETRIILSVITVVNLTNNVSLLLILECESRSTFFFLVVSNLLLFL